jgi:hypothetical protein
MCKQPLPHPMNYKTDQVILSLSTIYRTLVYKLPYWDYLGLRIFIFIRIHPHISTYIRMVNFGKIK